MSAYLPLIAGLLLSTSVLAQSSWSVTAGGGIGIDNIKSLDAAAVYPMINKKNTAYAGQAGMAYQYKKWQFALQINYLIVNNRQNASDGFISGIGDPLSQAQIAYYHAHGTQSITYHQLSMPLTVGYQIALTHGFSVVPAIGAEMYDNMNERVKPDGASEYQLSNSAFSANYNKFSLGAVASIHANYSVTKKVSLFAGPTAHLMLTNMQTWGWDQYTSSSVKYTQHNYVYLFDAGISVGL